MEAPRSLQGPGRGAARDLARRLGLGALIVALLGAAAGPASAAAGPGVVVSGPGVTRPWIGPAELAASAPGGSGEALPYTLRVSPGEGGQQINRAGMPVREVIRKAGADPDALGYLTVPRPDGTVAFLPGSDFAAPSPFEGGKPALISVDVDSTRFFRPVTDDPGDVNAEDNIATPAGEALALGLHDGNVLTVHAAATPTSAAAGQAVQFNASASGARSGEGVSFQWSFGDGGTAQGASVSHAFSGSGTYEVRAMAAGTAGSGGESRPVAVVVGSPPTTPQPGAAPPAAKPQKQAASGPSGRGRGGRGGEGSGRQGGNGAGRGRGSGGRGGGGANGAASGESSSAPAAPAPSLPATAPAPQSAPAPSPGESSPAAKPPAYGPPPDGGETVEGTLVANVLGPAATVAAGGSAAAAGGSESAPGAVAGGRDPVPLAALIVLGLLAAGVLLEWRGTRPRRR